MRNKSIFLTALIFFACCSTAGAADYNFTYKKGKVSVEQNAVKTGKDSVLAFSYGAAAEVRCGPDSRLEINSVTKTGESVFALKQGSCFVRIIDDGSGASVTLKTPFADLKSSGGAFYADFDKKAASVYGGSAGIEFNKRIARLTAGRIFSAGKITEIKPEDNLFRDWAVKRDKEDLVVNLQTEKNKRENISKLLGEAMAKAYCAGTVDFNKEAEPEDICVSVTISAKQAWLNASGVLTSGIIGALGVIDIKKDAGSGAGPYESQAFMPFIYETAAAIQKSVEQSEAGFMKNGRKTIIEAEGLPETDCAAIEKTVRGMPGFINVNQKKYHKTKAVFEVLQAGNGYDIAEALTAKFKKTNISIWKYSKNIVKLRVVKVER